MCARSVVIRRARDTKLCKPLKPRPLRANMLRSARLRKLAGAAVVGGAGAAMLFSPAAQCEAEQRKGKGPLQRRASVSDSINVVRADMSLAGAKSLCG